MSILKLFFSPAGRLDRKTYSLVSLAGFVLFGGLFVSLLGLAFSSAGVAGLKSLQGGIPALLSIAPMAIGVLILGAWVQICIVFKRGRDFSKTDRFAWIYMLLFLGPVVLYLQSDGGAVASFSRGLETVLFIPMLIMGFILMLKESIDGPTEQEEKMAARVVKRDQFDDSGLSLDTDLVERAAQLRAVAQSARVKTSQPAPAEHANTVYGRRQTASFGKR